MNGQETLKRLNHELNCDFAKNNTDQESWSNSLFSAQPPPPNRMLCSSVLENRCFYMNVWFGQRRFWYLFRKYPIPYLSIWDFRNLYQSNEYRAIVNRTPLKKKMPREMNFFRFRISENERGRWIFSDFKSRGRWIFSNFSRASRGRWIFSDLDPYFLPAGDDFFQTQMLIVARGENTRGVLLTIAR